LSPPPQLPCSEIRPEKRRRWPFPGKIFSLDTKSLPHELPFGERNGRLTFLEEFCMGFDTAPCPRDFDGSLASRIATIQSLRPGYRGD
jgi:hypothetical protein